MSFGHHPLERLEVAVVSEELHPTDRGVRDAVNAASRRVAWRPRHVEQAIDERLKMSWLRPCFHPTPCIHGCGSGRWEWEGRAMFATVRLATHWDVVKRQLAALAVVLGLTWPLLWRLARWGFKSKPKAHGDELPGPWS